MARRGPRQKEIVGRVMHEFKHGELTRGRGGKVRNPRQAIAIAFSEAGASRQQAPAENRKRLRRTEAAERRGDAGAARPEGPRAAGKAGQGGPTRADLYRRAQAAEIPGRSRMTRDELRRALARQ